MNGNISISQAEAYLRQIEQLAQEIDYARHEFGIRLERYRKDINPQTRIDLQSSVAHFEKYILPFAVAQRVEEVPPIEGAQTLTLGINGYWGAYEFRQLFEGIDYLSKVYTIRAKMSRPSPDFRLRRGMTRIPVYRKAKLSYYLSTREELRVRQIQFSSPGLVSFEGVGEVIKELRETLDYVITGVWVKHFLDTVYQIRDREIRKAEDEARRADAMARKAEAEARRAEADLRAIEARSKMKMAIRQLRQENRPVSNREGLGLEKLNEIADLGIRLEADGLANLYVFEDSVINAISVLHRLSYEQQKLKVGVPREKE